MKKVDSRRQNENAPRRVPHYFFILPATFFILIVRLYKLTLSPLIAFLAGPSGACRFEPSCSQYAIEALKTHGAVTGGWLATKRICRCHPWSDDCGEDPVPPRQLSCNHSIGNGDRARLGRCEARPRGSLLRSKLIHSLVPSDTAGVRREAHRTAAEAAALPKNSTAWLQPVHFAFPIPRSALRIPR